jgi:glutathione peroxidase
MQKSLFQFAFPRPAAILPRVKCAALGLATTMVLTAVAAAAPLYEIPLKDIDGKATSLKGYQGKVLLIVNVASKCGQTPQYAGLQELQQKLQARGFTVLAFPCNDFGGQEPGTAADIKTFCAGNYRVSFPLFEKVRIKGAAPHPLFAALTGKGSPLPGEVSWNFSKFLVNREGRLVKRFDSNTEPDDPELLRAVESALAAK